MLSFFLFFLIILFTTNKSRIINRRVAVLIATMRIDTVIVNDIIGFVIYVIDRCINVRQLNSESLQNGRYSIFRCGRLNGMTGSKV